MSTAARFSEDERARRVAGVRAGLDAHRIDALLAVGTFEAPGAVSWLTGYSPVFTPAWCVVTAEVCALVTVSYEGAHTHGDAWLEPDAIHHVPDPLATVRALLRGADRRVGVAGWEALSAPLARELGDAFGPTALLGELRARKSEEELAVMREAARITDVGSDAFVRAAQPGRSEVDVAAAIEAAMRAEGLERPQPLVLGSGPRSLDITPQPVDAPIAEGAMVLLDHGARAGGYCADVARALVAGEPSAAQRRLLETVHEMYAQARDALRDGADARAPHRAARAVAREAGYDAGQDPFTGHAIGADYHEPPTIGEDPGTLHAGMVVCVEPGLYVEGVGGARLENTILIGPDGPEDLTRSPLRLW